MKKSESNQHVLRVELRSLMTDLIGEWGVEGKEVIKLSGMSLV